MTIALVIAAGAGFIGIMTWAAILRDRMDQRQARAKHRWSPKHRLIEL